MSALVSSRNDPGRACFREWVFSVDFLASSGEVGEFGFGELWRMWGIAREPSYRVGGWYRSYGRDFKLVPVVSAVACRCIGHHLSRRHLEGFPRVAALACAMFSRGRCRELEGLIVGDPAACYLYADHLGGGLPPFMHNRLVLDSFSGSSFFVRRYLEDFC